MNISLKLITAALVGVLLQGCFHEDENAASMRTFQVDVHNLTNNQTLAPVGLVLHNEPYKPFNLGDAASAGLEMLAEGGDNSALLSEANAQSATLDTQSGLAVIPAGLSETLMTRVNITRANDSSPHLSLVGMLVNTNDGFIAINSADLGEMAMGESLTLYANVYDAGTELNSEAAADLAGQGGEGFNVARNDRDFVAIHPGIVGQEDGLAGSALNQSHRFNNPGVKVVVTRQL